MNKIISVKQWKRNMRDINDPLVQKTSNCYIKSGTLEPIRLLTDEEIKSTPQKIFDLRKAAECHKIVRRNAQNFIKPGMKILDICNKIEADIVKIFGRNDLIAGVAFPVGCSINNVIAHDTANPNDNRTIGYDDICKIDFGVHINGMIIDSAFSVAFNPQYEELLEASREATATGIKMSRPDAPIYDISKAIKEVIESYEVTIGGKLHQIKSVNDLGSHSIDRYIIHSGDIILCAPYESREYKQSRIKGDQQYAIETFASTGTGKMFKSKSRQSNHYMLNKDNPLPYRGKLKTINNVYNWIKKNRSTLAFCPRWLEDQKIKGVTLSLNELARRCNPPIVIEYPPLEDIEGSYVSHYEHTIYVHEYGTEILSKGDDY
jgi:methionyl aminopeptidase